jgi:hypothetical protein
MSREIGMSGASAPEGERAASLGVGEGSGVADADAVGDAFVGAADGVSVVDPEHPARATSPTVATATPDRTTLRLMGLTLTGVDEQAMRNGGEQVVPVLGDDDRL